MLKYLLWMLLIPVSICHAEIKVITAPEMKYMLENKDVVAINVLSRVEYSQQHIKGSINIPVTEISTSSKLPKDKDADIIFYCMGIKCPYSEKASKKADEMGYTNIYWFKGGIEAWYQFRYPMVIDKSQIKLTIAKISPAKVNELVLKHSVQIVDVRPKWWKGPSNYIKGSIFIPLIDLDTSHKQIDKTKPIVVNDGYMKQSIPAARYLLSQGYNVAGVVKGGIARWIHEQIPAANKQNR